MDLLLGTLGAALLCLGLWLGFQLLLMSVVLVQMLRVPFHPQRLQRGEWPGELPPDQQAAVEEVQALGFRIVATGWHEAGPMRSPSLLLRHETEPAFANLVLSPGLAGYVLSFFSLDAAGISLSTGNRIDWMTFASLPGQQLADAWANTPAEHWQFHQARIAGQAIQPLSDEEAWQHCAASYESFVPTLLERSLLRTSQGIPHLSLRAASRVAWQWRRVRRKLAVPYASLATEGEHQPSYSTRSYLLAEATLANRPARRRLKATVLVASAAITLLLWAWAFNWQSALAVVAILLLHEGGHALAMRAFGYRDMSMFFIPFLGAMVTARPREIAAWKQALVLLAGPVPGLLLGLWLLAEVNAGPGLSSDFNWKMAAFMAIGINLFNLLPLTPLDGGRLVELSLFSRWPRSRLLFSALSILAMLGLALWFKSLALGVVGLALGFTLAYQLRISRLDRLWQEGLPLEEQLRQLFEKAQQLFGALGFMRHYPMVKAVVERRKVARPEAWESAMVLSLLLMLWGGSGLAAWQNLPGRAKAEPDLRSAEQRVFDEHYTLYGENEANMAADMKAMRQAAAKLAADDSRRVDLVLLETWEVEAAQKTRLLEQLVTEGRTGSYVDAEDLQRQWLGSVFLQHADAPLPQRIAAQEAAIARFDELLPGQAAGSIEARLRHAELVDRGGDTQTAESLLARVRALAERADDCRCELRRVLTAQAWYFMSHGRADDAVSVIESSAVGRSLQRSTHELSRTYAWALLEAGRAAEGLEQMRVAVSWPATQGWQVRLGLRKPQRPRPWQLMDAAYALHRGPQPGEAAALFTPETRDTCISHAEDDATTPELADGQTDPWQQLRERRLIETARAICPAPKKPKNTASPAKTAPAG